MEEIRRVSTDDLLFQELHGLTYGILELPLFEQTPRVEVDLDMHVPEAKAWIDKNESLVNEFEKMLKSLRNVAGLASNQVVMKTTGQRLAGRFFLALNERAGKFELFLRPKILNVTGGPTQKREGCLTWPGKIILADRYDKITIEYFDHLGRYCTQMFEGFKGQVIQHEIGHLDGVEEVAVGKDYMTVKRQGEKVGRNDPCTCGSGKKYKKCCGGVR